MTAATETPVELIQFAYSHFNEKARWGLDWKRVPHRRRTLLPGPHGGTVKKLTGRTQVPVVRFGEEIVDESARILDELERRFPDPPLYPKDPADRARALEIQQHFDDKVGPEVRRALFSVMIEHPGYLTRMFGCEHGGLTRLLYRSAFPMARRLMIESMKIDDPEAVRGAFEGSRRALDFVAETGGAGYLVGDQFSVADLTAAALLAPVVSPPDSPMDRPRPLPDALARAMSEFAAHPGAEWVREVYRRHRPPSSALPR